MLATKEEMISRLSLESLRAKEDILEVVEEVKRRDTNLRHSGDWWLEFAYALLKEGFEASVIIYKLKHKVDPAEHVTEELIYRLAARAECGLRTASACMERADWPLIESDLDNDRGLEMLQFLLGKGLDGKKAGRVLRRMIYEIDQGLDAYMNEAEVWTDKIPWLGTGSVTRGIRRLRIIGLFCKLGPGRRWYNDLMMYKFGSCWPLVMELILKF